MRREGSRSNPQRHNSSIESMIALCGAASRAKRLCATGDPIAVDDTSAVSSHKVVGGVTHGEHVTDIDCAGAQERRQNQIWCGSTPGYVVTAEGEIRNVCPPEAA
jgi:hypothetical protein